MITATDRGKEFGAQTLFEGASFQLNPGARYGLVGANDDVAHARMHQIDMRDGSQRADP